MQLAIAKILGLSNTQETDSWNFWVPQIRKGIPKKALIHCLQALHVSLSDAERVLPITARTLQRYDMETVLKPDVSGHVIALAKVYSQAVEVFEDEEKARRWLKKPSRTLGGNIPFFLLDSPMGIQAVEDELERIEHGVYY